MAHVGPPDMRHAIGFALHWPERRDLPVERLDLARDAKAAQERIPAAIVANWVQERSV